MKSQGILILALIGLLSGCQATVELNQSSFETEQPYTVAVLPFKLDKEAEGKRARIKADKIRELIRQNLAAKGYRVILNRHIDRNLSETSTAVYYDPWQAKKLGQTIKADILVYGEIKEFYNLRAGILYRQVIDGSIRVMSTQSGAQLASVSQKETNTGGVLLESGQLIDAISGTIDNSNDIGFIRLATKFADSVTRGVPGPISKRNFLLPRVTVSKQTIPENSGAEPLNADDQFSLEVFSPDGSELELVVGQERLPYIRQTLGNDNYRLIVRIQRNQKVSGALNVLLTDGFGLTGRTQVVESIHIDSTPVQSIKNLTWKLTANKKVELSWARKPSENKQTYRVYKIDKFGRPLQVAEIEGHSLLVANERADYAVAAVGARGGLGVLNRLSVGVKE